MHIGYNIAILLLYLFISSDYVFIEKCFDVIIYMTMFIYVFFICVLTLSFNHNVSRNEKIYCHNKLVYRNYQHNIMFHYDYG